MNLPREATFRISIFAPLIILVVYFLLLGLAQKPFFDSREFVKTLNSREILFPLKLSLITATTATLLATTIALPAAYALSRFSFTGKYLIDTFLDIPIVLSPVAMGTLILMGLHTEIGRSMELRGVSISYSIGGVVVAQFTVIVAMSVRLLKAVFDEINPRFEQVARVLGCSAHGAFLRVSLPLAKKGILASFVLAWARAIGEFGATVTVAGTIRGKTETIPTSIYLAMAGADLNRVVILITILVIISFGVLLLIRIIAGVKS